MRTEIDKRRLENRRALGARANDALCSSAAEAQPATDLAVWVAWSGEAADLRRELKPIGALEQHTLVSVQPINRDCGLWRCGFAFVGREPDQDQHVLALLRRVAVCAPWLRVERFDGAPA